MKICNFRNILCSGDYQILAKKFQKRKQEWVRLFSQLRRGIPELLYGTKRGKDHGKKY